MLAVICKHPSVVKYLLFQAKADPNWTKRPVRSFISSQWLTASIEKYVINHVKYTIKDNAQF